MKDVYELPVPKKLDVTQQATLKSVQAAECLNHIELFMGSETHVMLWLGHTYKIDFKMDD